VEDNPSEQNGGQEEEADDHEHVTGVRRAEVLKHYVPSQTLEPEREPATARLEIANTRVDFCTRVRLVSRGRERTAAL
jgi:hypothetical protein